MSNFSKTDNNFFDSVFSLINEGTKIFNDDFVKKMQDSLKNGYYKSEEWKDGKLVNKEEKEWKDGKLIKSEGETHNVLQDKQNECGTNCHCKKENECKCEKLENEYLDKLKKVDAEVDKLREVINALTEENTKLKKENFELTKLNKDYKDKFDKLKSIF